MPRSWRTLPTDIAVWTYSISHDALRPKWRKAPATAREYAHDLYAMLRVLDASGARAIWIERPPSDWLGVNDRLMRAAAGTRPST